MRQLEGERGRKSMYYERIVKIKGFKPIPLEGLWWQKLYEADGRVEVELVGPDTVRYESFRDAVETIEKLIGLPETSLMDMIIKFRPDVKKETWLKTYLRGSIKADQLETP